MERRPEILSSRILASKGLSISASRPSLRVSPPCPAHFAGDQDEFCGGKEGAQLVEKLDAIFAGELVIEDENAHALEMALAARASSALPKVWTMFFSPKKCVEGSADVRVIFHHDNALIVDMARHGFKISRDAIISSTISFGRPGKQFSP
jgi:hypothetical protein